MFKKADVMIVVSRNKYMIQINQLYVISILSENINNNAIDQLQPAFSLRKIKTKIREKKILILLNFWF